MSESLKISVDGTAEVTPEIVAQMFWEMDAEQQADFFAALEGMAGIQLCFQMAAVVREIQERCDKGDRNAQNGFQTMLNHAANLAEGMTDFRVWAAQHEISRLANQVRSAP